MYEQKPGQFVLFKNNKDGNEARPDYTGDGLDLEGKPIRVAAWIKQGKNAKFMACNIQAKDAPKQKAKQAPRPQIDKGQSGFDDLEEIPF